MKTIGQQIGKDGVVIIYICFSVYGETSLYYYSDWETTRNNRRQNENWFNTEHVVTHCPIGQKIPHYGSCPGSPLTVSHSYPKTLVLPHWNLYPICQKMNNVSISQAISALEAHHSHAGASCDNSAQRHPHTRFYRQHICYLHSTFRY